MAAAARPALSVVIPCYNQGGYLARALDSVLGDRDLGTEVVVVDDGSTDDTAAVAARYGGAVRYVLRANGGLPAARNSGIRAASGELLLFLDADDWVAPGALREVIAAAAVSNADCFHGSWDNVDGDGRLLSRVEGVALGDDALLTILAGNRFPCHACVVRRRTVERVGMFDERLQACEDWHLWLRLAAAGARFVVAPSFRVAYRRHAGTMSTDYGRLWRAGCRVLAAGRDIAAERDIASARPRYTAAAREGARAWRRYCSRRLLQGLRTLPPQARVAALARAVRDDPRVPATLVGGFLRYARTRLGARRPVGRATSTGAGAV